MNNLVLTIWRLLHLPKKTQLRLVRLREDQFLIGVTGIIFNDNDEVLLFKHTYREVAWSLPGGYLKAGEHPREGLEREIEEESGLVVSADRRLKVRTDRETARLDLAYIGYLIGGDFRPSAEVAAYGFFTFENLPNLPRNQLFLIKEALSQKGTNKMTEAAASREGGQGHLLLKFRSWFSQRG